MAHKRVCDVCAKAFTKDKGGAVIAHPYGEYLRDSYQAEMGLAADEEVNWAGRLNPKACNRLLEGEHKAFVNAVVRCYAIQFDELYTTKRTSGDIRDGLEDMLLRHDPAKALPKVLANVPKGKSLWLIVHDDCLPEDLREAGYQIDLKRISTADQAIEWTLQVGEKTWWNTEGWMYVLRKLFGRQR